MAISASASTVTLPRENPQGFAGVLDFLDHRFPRIGREVWAGRIRKHLVTTDDGSPVTLETPYLAGARVHYYREVEIEPVVPFQETILFLDDHLLVACKPHFLPVVPSGPYVNETLLNRLKQQTRNPGLVPINRIDRETAGLVLFSVQPETRGLYQRLFMDRRVTKTYEAVTQWPETAGPVPGRMDNRIVRGEPWFRNTIVPGTPNAATRLELLETRGNRARFRLFPETGKKHQLRLHLGALGCPIVNDRYYPELLPKQKDDWDRPLQLLSREVAFLDPISGKERVFASSRSLAWQMD
ncbi:MAG: pseudouridine synthase [Desulfobacteraceae bacterium]|nr:pseudouridine synthase [Desulfobacteraceae bacterium]